MAWDDPSYFSAQVTAEINKIDYKESVRVRVGSNINIALPGASLDGIAMASDERVLLTNQTTSSENGIWLWDGAASSMSRPGDFNASNEVSSGATTFVSEGTSAGQKWSITTADPITVDATALTWTQTSGTGASYTDANAISAVEGEATLVLGGSISIKRTAIDSGDSPYTLAANDRYVASNSTAGAITVNLPAAATAGAGRILDIKDSHRQSTANNITIDGSGAETIDGAATHVIASNGASVTIVCDGVSNWEII